MEYDRLYIGEHDTEDSFVGEVQFCTFGQGSKQLSRQPFLRQEKALICLFLESDNPFTNIGMASFFGGEVSIEEKWRNNRFIVQKKSVQDT